MIYVASKANHRPMWREFRERGIVINSRWIDIDDKYSVDPCGLDYSSLWSMCIEDVLRCDVVIVYALSGEVLKGALVEVGAALALNKRVILTGQKESYTDNGTWINHPGIVDCTGRIIRRVFEETCGSI